jgi:antitoxin CptB
MQTGMTMADDLDVRRRRASYRAHHRGTKEMDLLFGRYADARLAALSGEALQRFERFLELPDPMLQAWIFEGGPCDNPFHDLVSDIRIFHRLAADAD